MTLQPVSEILESEEFRKCTNCKRDLHVRYFLKRKALECNLIYKNMFVNTCEPCRDSVRTSWLKQKTKHITAKSTIV